MAAIWPPVDRAEGGTPSALGLIAVPREGGTKMADDSDMVYPTGLTPKQADEIQQGLMWGTRIYFGIALFAHLLAYIYSPWLH
jgi:light-harvesting protein B-800-850 beta chain